MTGYKFSCMSRVYSCSEEKIDKWLLVTRSLDKRKRLLIAMDVAFGMEYLHGKNIVHFDLKSDNLLVNLRDPHRPICKVSRWAWSYLQSHDGGIFMCKIFDYLFNFYKVAKF